MNTDIVLNKQESGAYYITERENAVLSYLLEEMKTSTEERKGMEHFKRDFRHEVIEFIGRQFTARTGNLRYCQSHCSLNPENDDFEINEALE